MPRQSYTSVLNHTTDADFRAWAKQLSDAIKACLTQTSDTGQVDWTLGTQAKPSGSPTFPYYEVYRFNDPLQATAPVYIKISYGQASNGQAGIRMQVATVTNGAGSLSGLTTSTSLDSYGGTNTISQTTYACYKDGCFTLAWGAKAAGSRILAYVERSRDSTGASTPDGVIVMTAGQSSTTTILSYQANVTSSSTIPCLVNSLQPARSSGLAVVNLYNWFLFTPDIHNLTGIFTYKDGEIPQYSEVDAALVGGTSRHYLCVGSFIAAGYMAANGGPYDVSAILWEV